MTTLRSAYLFHSAHVWPQDFRQFHAAVGLLVSFQQGNIKPRQRCAAAIEYVYESPALGVVTFEPDIGPARLEILAIRAA